MLVIDVNQLNEAVAYTVSCVVAAAATVAMTTVLFMTSPWFNQSINQSKRRFI